MEGLAEFLAEEMCSRVERGSLRIVRAPGGNEKAREQAAWNAEVRVALGGFVTKTCKAGCGRTFQGSLAPYKTPQRYCSPACRPSNNWQRKIAGP